MSTRTNIQLADICDQAATQSRAEISEANIKDYAERMAAGDEFPPVVVFGKRGQWYLADGWHRFLAAKSLGEKTLKAIATDGTLQDAIWWACRANSDNGVHRTNADKRRAVEMALRNFGDKSDREIARHCRVSNTFVGSVRVEVQVSTVDTCGGAKVTPSDDSGERTFTSEKRTGKDGKQYSVKEKLPRGKTADSRPKTTDSEPLRTSTPSAVESAPAVQVQVAESAPVAISPKAAKIQKGVIYHLQMLRDDLDIIFEKISNGELDVLAMRECATEVQVFARKVNKLAKEAEAAAVEAA